MRNFERPGEEKKIGKVCEERDNRGGERTLTPLAAFVQVTV